MLATGHWSVTGPERCNDYHIEFGAKGPLSPALIAACEKATSIEQVPVEELRAAFNIYKNFNFDTPTSYGTWDWNHDFRDNSTNIEIAALCMAGATTNDYGQYPYTRAHAWMHALLFARVAKLKGFNCMGSFQPIKGYMNGPLFNISTHGERAYQTQNLAVETADRGYSGYRGYGLFSADPQCRWDIATLDSRNIGALKSFETAYPAIKGSAAWLRARAAEIVAKNLTADMWGLDREVPR